MVFAFPKYFVNLEILDSIKLVKRVIIAATITMLSHAGHCSQSEDSSMTCVCIIQLFLTKHTFVVPFVQRNNMLLPSGHGS